MIRPAKRSRTRNSPDKLNTRVVLEYRDISDLKAYEFNPRDNDPAIESVANSIKTFGFLIPVVVDGNNTLIAGHTRVAAATLLGMHEVPTIQVEHLTQAEVDAFRVIDNKVAELAKWDFDLLSGEIGKLQGSGLTLTDFGWSREEIDCLSAVVQDDCLNVEGLVDLEAQERMRRMERRAPATARFVLGELVFFVSATDYRRWVEGIRVRYDYNEADIVAGLKQMLGITEDTVNATNRISRTRTPNT